MKKIARVGLMVRISLFRGTGMTNSVLVGNSVET